MLVFLLSVLLPSRCPSLFFYSLHHALSAGVLLLGLQLHFTKPAVAHSTPIVEYHPPFLPNTQRFTLRSQHALDHFEVTIRSDNNK